MSKLETMVASLLAWFTANARDLPWRRTRDPYAIWISEVMLQQTQVATVIRYWERWMRALPDVPALAQAPATQILKLWEGLGYYRRARHLHRAAREIMRRHGGQFPRTFDEVLALPGVGRYTAGAVCSLAFNHPAPVLDGNVTRVLARRFGLREDVRHPATRERLWRLAGSLTRTAQDGVPRDPGLVARGWRYQRVQSRPCGALNEALMELGALVCLPREPRCDCCPWARECQARRHGLTQVLPRKGSPARAEARRRLVFVCQKRGRRLVWQRPAEGVNAQLWELPSLEANGYSSPREAARALLGPIRGETHPVTTVRHAITRHRYTLEVHQVRLAPGESPAVPGGRWLTARECEEKAFSAAHRRILHRLALRGPAPNPG